MKKAVITGSFDPITLGHEWLIKKASEMFDEIVVVIAKNDQKKSYFLDEEKESFVKDSVKDLKNVTVVTIEDQFIVSYAESIGAKFLVRGVRNAQDLEYERTIERMNQSISSKVQTVFLMPPSDLQHISSSLVKSLVGFTGWNKVVAPLVPPSVYSSFLRKTTEVFLRARWKDFSEDEDMFGVILNKYSEPHRYYHTTEHLVNLFKGLDLFSLPRHKQGLLTFIIFFHDLYYDPMAKDNEERSAREYESFGARNGFTEHILKKGSEIILGTKNHHQAPNYELMDVFLDLDLRILAASAEKFLEYENNIRLEYNQVPEDIYIRERSRIMTSLKGNYRTETGIRLWNTQRSENLKKY